MFLPLFRQWTRWTMRMAGAESRSVAVGRYDVRVWEAGAEGDRAVLLLHGLGSTSASWKPVAAALARHRRVIVPELSALGGTGGPRAGLDVRDGARVAAELIERAGGEASVCGTSLGGWMAVRLALERPELVRRLILVDPAGYKDQDWDRIRRLVRVSDKEDVGALYETLFVRTPWTLKLVREGFRRAYSSDAVTEILDALDESDAYDDQDLARIRAPTRLIWGEQDRMFELSVGRAMERAIPDCRLEVVPGCAHALQWERPRALVDAVLRAELD